ncbi:hypothetical protein ACIPJS_01485 [Streptomyces sp. NPDC086783]|uniref:hypothetical protein n=1 Tax=Streptomyces sp. NPDC086783 TaxID=3365758 RepID=UPI00382F4F7A
MAKNVFRAAVLFGAAAALAAATAAASPAAAPRSADTAGQRVSRTVLVDCFERSQVRPADFILACGDGNSRLTSLHWTRWDAKRAVATGFNVVNDCKPYCAAGTFRSYAVTVRLDHPQTWKKQPQLSHYTRMSLTYTDGRPDGYARTVHQPLWN